MSDRRESNSEKVAYRSWGGLRERMAGSSRSDEGRAVGIWAIDQLSAVFDDQWLAKQTSNDLLLAPFHAVAFEELVDFALRLHTLRLIDGMTVVLSELMNDAMPRRQLHTRLMFDVAGLAVQHGHHVELEKRLKSSLSPTDVVFVTGSGALAVETFVVYMDKNMRDGRDYTYGISHEFDRIQADFGVKIDWELEAVLSEEETLKWLAQVEETASLVKADGTARTVDYPDGNVLVSPTGDIGQNPSVYTGPLIGGKKNERLRWRLSKKAAQAVKAETTWIRVDVMDGLWQFTEWATWSLQQKGEALAQCVKQALSDFHSLHGAVLSSGPAMAQGQFDNESVQLEGGGFATRRNLPSSRVRETVIAPLETTHANEVSEWVKMYDREPDWLDWALQEAGLPPSSAAFASRS